MVVSPLTPRAMQTRTLIRIVSGFAGLFLTGCVAPQPYSPPASAPVQAAPPPPAPTATANAGEISRVTSDPAPEFYPRVSPDGTQLLFYVVDLTQQTDAKALSIAGVSLQQSGRRLVAGPGAWFPAWYPDSKSFVYTYIGGEKPTLVRSPYGGVGMTFITPTAMGADDGQPAVSPDGKRIAFHTRIGQITQVCTVNADGSSFTVFVEGTSPRWHPSGSLLAFDRMVGQQSHVFTIDLASGQVTQLTSGSSDDAFPVWSPDGRWLTFISRRDGRWHVYAMKADGSSVTQLTRGDAQEFMPEWGADGWIYFTSDAGSPVACGPDGFRWRYADIWRLKPVLSD